MKETRGYDNDLKMFREPSKDANMGHLRFMRWLGEQGRLEHAVAGPPTGELAPVIKVETSLAIPDTLRQAS
jgi:hypothetical protein